MLVIYIAFGHLPGGFVAEAELKVEPLFLLAQVRPSTPQPVQIDRRLPAAFGAE